MAHRLWARSEDARKVEFVPIIRKTFVVQRVNELLVHM